MLRTVADNDVKVIRADAGDHIEACVREHGEEHKDQKLIVIFCYGEYLFEREFLAGGCSVFFPDGRDADGGEQKQSACADQGKNHKRARVVNRFAGHRVLRDADKSHQNGRADLYDALTETGKGSRDGGDNTAFACVIRKRRHHRPVGDIGEGVRHAPEDIHKGDVNIQCGS